MIVGAFPAKTLPEAEPRTIKVTVSHSPEGMCFMSLLLDTPLSSGTASTAFEEYYTHAPASQPT